MQESLSVVIPALNEEDAIGSIIERSLAARATICERANLSAVEIIVVSDGSTDRTAEIASGFADVTTISYAKNRGYGAAITTGFAKASGSLVAFLDADGTCDPLFFSELCSQLQLQNADIAIGTRLGTESEMPAVRRVGNRLYAGLLMLWGAHGVTDSASGMRVVRRTALERIYPLPEGMSFTPAMSSIALFDRSLKIIELPMRYAERTGQSKLNVIKDGFRFLRVILKTALSYRPFRFFGASGLALLGLAVAYGASPVVYYARNRYLEDWMFYRLSAVSVAIISGVNLIAVGLLAQQTVSLIHEDFAPSSRLRMFLERLVRERFMLWGFLAILAGVALNGRTLIQYFTTGHLTAHWIFIVVGGLLVTFGIECVSFGLLARVLNLLTFRKRYSMEHPQH